VFIDWPRCIWTLQPRDRPLQIAIILRELRKLSARRQLESPDCGCARGEIYSGGLAEFGQEAHPALMGVFQRFSKCAVCPR
jgi:hypothetical protein